LGLPFPPRNLHKKFGANPHRGQTHRHTHKPTPVKTYSLAFSEIKKKVKKEEREEGS